METSTLKWIATLAKDVDQAILGLLIMAVLLYKQDQRQSDERKLFFQTVENKNKEHEAERDRWREEIKDLRRELRR